MCAQRRYLAHVTVALFQAQLEDHRERERLLEVRLEQVVQEGGSLMNTSAAVATGHVFAMAQGPVCKDQQLVVSEDQAASTPQMVALSQLVKKVLPLWCET